MIDGMFEDNIFDPFSSFSTCSCDNPIICCGGNGCLCTRCGLPERLDLSFSEPLKTWDKPLVQERLPQFEEHTVNICDDPNRGSIVYRGRHVF